MRRESTVHSRIVVRILSGLNDPSENAPTRTLIDLPMSPYLQRISRAYFSHYSPEGQDLRDRLRLLYGDRAGLDIQEAVPSGTVVTVRIPA